MGLHMYGLDTRTGFLLGAMHRLFRGQDNPRKKVEKEEMQYPLTVGKYSMDSDWLCSVRVAWKISERVSHIWKFVFSHLEAKGSLVVLV